MSAHKRLLFTVHIAQAADVLLCGINRQDATIQKEHAKIQRHLKAARKVVDCVFDDSRLAGLAIRWLEVSLDEHARTHQVSPGVYAARSGIEHWRFAKEAFGFLRHLRQ